jgi:PAS domain S-box-containing protein
VADQSPAIFEAIISDMVEGVIFLDDHDIVRVCNPAAERIRGVKAARIMGRNILQLHARKTHDAVRDLLENLKSGKVSSIIRVIRVHNRYFENSYSAIRNSSGNYLGTLLVSRDITEQKRLFEEIQNLRNRQRGDNTAAVVANSEGMQKVLELAEAVAGLDSTILITGENGTGKELVVDLIHALSPRHEGPLVRVNCAALPETLIESELFGHVRGAFTGATEDRKGKFELAHGGTIFLDEIGEIPYPSQAKLLRAIQEKTVQPVGGRKEIRVDVRIVAATNRDLTRSVESGEFREDLLYRLNVISIDVPPLRQRRDDIIPMAELFLSQYSRQMKKPLRRLSPQVVALLLNYPFPGNVRQLKHAMERAVALGKGELVLPDDLPPEITGRQDSPPSTSFVPDQPLRQVVDDFEKEYIAQALHHHGKRKVETARSLGISRKSLWEKIARYDLDLTDVTEG